MRKIFILIMLRGIRRMNFINKLEQDMKNKQRYDAINWEINNYTKLLADNVRVFGKGNPKQIDYEFQLTKWMTLRRELIDKVNNR